MRYLIWIVMALTMATYADAQNKQKTQYTPEQQRFIDQVKSGVSKDQRRVKDAAMKTSGSWTAYFYDRGEMVYYNPADWDEAYPATRNHFQSMTPKQKVAVIGAPGIVYCEQSADGKYTESVTPQVGSGQRLPWKVYQNGTESMAGSTDYKKTIRSYVKQFAKQPSEQ